MTDTITTAEFGHKALGTRKIVHVDMDAFYASVEQRDNAGLRGRPVIVAWKGKRSVVCAASYEARRFGVRSAMPAVTAERLCPEAVFVPPDFTRYKAVSIAIRGIFAQHTDAIEPLSLDEAYLDVTANKTGLGTATLVAKTIRQQIRAELNLTASAGVAPNKFLAKIASDWRKPDGLFVIQPHEAHTFLLTLPVGRIPGVGKVTEARMAKAGIKSVGHIQAMDLSGLEQHFGSYAQRLYELARGIDHTPVIANRVRKQVSAEDTFPDDIPLVDCEPHVRRLAEKVWNASQQNARRARTVVLKLKTKEFVSLTRSHTPQHGVCTVEEFTRIAVALCGKIEFGPQQLYRLAGVGLSNFARELRKARFRAERRQRLRRASSSRDNSSRCSSRMSSTASPSKPRTTNDLRDDEPSAALRRPLDLARVTGELLRIAVAGEDPGETTLPLFCRTEPRSIYRPRAVKPVSS